MGLNSKIALLITGLLAMLLFISSEVAAARNLKEGEVVRETNRVGGNIHDHDVSKLSIPSNIGTSNYIVGGGDDVVIPGTAGVVPVIGGGGSLQGQAVCRYSCCVQDVTVGTCLRCCSISK